jgi:sugar/nucleoside kinase (ribokinase family)
MRADGELAEVPSLLIPPEEIKGSVGAGDAFCAACLYALNHHMSLQGMLEFASAAAACNLFAENATDGMRGKAEIAEMAKNHKRRTLN